MTFAWLLGDVPSGDFDATPEIEARIDALATRAQLDTAARNALYDALAFKIDRFVRRYWFRHRGRLVLCTRDDIGQEAFLVFCDLVMRWPARDSFLGYFLSRFPYRLARAIDVIERGWAAGRLTPLDLSDGLEPGTRDAVGLTEIGVGLSPRDRLVLSLRVDHGLRFAEIAALLDVHPRTVRRSWARITRAVRLGLEASDAMPSGRSEHTAKPARNARRDIQR